MGHFPGCDPEPPDPSGGINDTWTNGYGSHSHGMWDPDYEHPDGNGNGMFPGQLVDDYTSGKSKFPVRETKVRAVDLKNSAKVISPLVRNFRENGSCTSTSYCNLLSRMCCVCEIPPYKKNRPMFVYAPDGPSNQRGVFSCKAEIKILKLHRLGDVRAFIMLWFLYLEGRNDGFWVKGDEEVSDTIRYRPCLKRARDYCKEIMETSEPQQVRNLKTRSYVEIWEI